MAKVALLIGVSEYQGLPPLSAAVKDISALGKVLENPELGNFDSVEILPLLGVVIFVLLGGFGLLASAYSFKNKRHFGRAPAVLANLIALGVAKYQFEGGLWFVALPLVMVALITLYCALTIVPESGDL